MDTRQAVLDLRVMAIEIRKGKKPFSKDAAHALACEITRLCDEIDGFGEVKKRATVTENIKTWIYGFRVRRIVSSK